jgi:hypothetical protein
MSYNVFLTELVQCGDASHVFFRDMKVDEVKEGNFNGTKPLYNQPHTSTQ